MTKDEELLLQRAIEGGAFDESGRDFLKIAARASDLLGRRVTLDELAKGSTFLRIGKRYAEISYNAREGSLIRKLIIHKFLCGSDDAVRDERYGR